MHRIKRPTFLFFYFREDKFVDVWHLLRGALKPVLVQQTYAASLLTGREYPVTGPELKILQAVTSSRWESAQQVAAKLALNVELIEELIRKGLLLSNRKAKFFLDLRRKDETLSTTKWNHAAAFYHFTSRWQDVDVRMRLPDQADRTGDWIAESEALLRQFVKRNGYPPSHFHDVANCGKSFKLPLVRRRGPVFRVLTQRKTTRSLDARKPLSIDQLSVILYYVFGCLGYVPFLEGKIVGLKKTSPSGGALHPIEVYPLIVNVAGLDSGLYHYNVRNHALDLIKELERSKAQDWGDEFTVGQDFPRRAGALFILTARFYRNYWKYRKHPKAYGVLLMDAGHLSQTFYLVCTELGLGAFFTAAINSANIEGKLGVDGFQEGAIGICGCGPVAKDASIDPEFRTYIPRRTRL